MAHIPVLVLYIILFVLLEQCSASPNQYFDKPGTAIIDSVPIDNNIITSDERGDQVLVQNSAETCPETGTVADNPTSEDQLSPEFVSLNHHTPDPDPYLRTIFHKGKFYPYSAYKAYNIHQGNDMKRGRDLYNDVWYPYNNPSVYTSVPYSNISPVNFLPPVYARLYEKSWPTEQEWYPSQIRRQRQLLDDEELLKQLEYDSIMKNILPTMPIPMPRGAGISQPAKVPYIYAVFPHGASDCSIPILLGCAPRITYGSNMENQNLEPVPYAHAYRNLLESKKVHDHVDVTDDKAADKH